MVDVLNGMERTNVTSIAGTETSVLVIIIDADVSVLECDITVVINSSLTVVVMTMASMVTTRPAWELVTS